MRRGLRMAALMAGALLWQVPASHAVGPDVDTTPLSERDTPAAGTLRTAAALAKQRQFEQVIALLAPLRAENSADVENLLGYAHRKLKRMEPARVHYERALQLDPAHVPTLEYYGEWYVEMGMPEHARAHLARLAALCGACEAWRDLKFAIETGRPREH
jgi:tetratricopeptide (TPR) repeat protein